MTKRTALDLAALLVAGIVIVFNLHAFTDFARELLKRHHRKELFAELKPVRLANCTLARFGNTHDGGYLMCGNLLGDVRSAYSYGIGGRDEWGCAMAQTLAVPVHEYDCFDTRRPDCAGVRSVFHEECVGEALTDANGRVFDTLASQIARNGDAEKRLVVKMDIEGAEWQVLHAASDEIFARIDQLVVEFHETDQGQFVDVLRKLKRSFFIAHVHFNNSACAEGVRPFPSRAYEVLFVRKSLAEVSARRGTPVLPAPLDRPNYPSVPDCQAVWH